MSAASIDFNEFKAKFIEENGLEEESVKKACKVQVVYWEKNGQGNPVAFINGRQIYPDKNYIGTFEPGQIWVVKLKEPSEVTNYCWATPVERLSIEKILRLGDIKIEDIVFDSRGGIKPSFSRALDKDMPELSSVVKQIEAVATENEQLKFKVNNLNQAFQDVKVRMAKQAEEFTEKEKKLKEETKVAKTELAQTKAQVAKEAKADATKDKVISDLEKKLDDMEKKVLSAEINTQNLKAKDEREMASLNEKIGVLTSQKEAVAKAKLAQDNQIKELNALVKSKDQEIEALKAAPVVQTVSEDVSGYKEEIESLKATLDQKEQQIADLMTGVEVAEEKAEMLPEFDPDFKPNLTIRRDSPTTLASDWFTAPRYNILMSVNPMVLLIRPDPDGMVVCSDYTIDIDGLDKMIDFKPKRAGGSQYLEVQFTRDMTAAKVAL